MNSSIDAGLAMENLTVAQVLAGFANEAPDTIVSNTMFWKSLGVSEEWQTLASKARLLRVLMEDVQHQAATNQPPFLRFAKAVGHYKSMVASVEAIGALSDEQPELPAQSLAERFDTLRDTFSAMGLFHHALMWDEVKQTGFMYDQHKEALAIQCLAAPEALTKGPPILPTPARPMRKARSLAQA